DMADFGGFYFKDIYIGAISKDTKEKFLNPDMIPAFKSLTDELDAINTLDRRLCEDAFRRVLESCNIKLKALAQPVRLALTGRLVSPGIFEIISTLGKKRVISRLKNAIIYMEESYED
ncbi:MAG: glutamate--tRNA ligase, partial [Thermodesulfobacteriota bacterium]|nr:glutamate--tRNA ligase [Thermodesulfobacteriota bacterium]